MKNYKTDILYKMTKKELIDFIKIDQHLVEKLEIEYAGYTHTGIGNGPDGITATGDPIELKSQVVGDFSKYKLRGRAKYSAISNRLATEKIATNEKTYVVGYDMDSGDIFYRFSFRFRAIAQKYKDAIESSNGKSWTNCDVVPFNYASDDSFEILFVAPTDVLVANKHNFLPKFLHWLLEYNETHKNDYKMFDLNYNAAVSYKWDTVISILETDKRKRENIG